MGGCGAVPPCKMPRETMNANARKSSCIRSIMCFSVSSRGEREKAFWRAESVFFFPYFSFRLKEKQGRVGRHETNKNSVHSLLTQRTNQERVPPEEPCIRSHVVFSGNPELTFLRNARTDSISYPKKPRSNGDSSGGYKPESFPMSFP